MTCGLTASTRDRPLDHGGLSARKRIRPVRQAGSGFRSARRPRPGRMASIRPPMIERAMLPPPMKAMRGADEVTGVLCGRCLGPNSAEPMRTWVAPAAMAASRSALMPIDSTSKRPLFFGQRRPRRPRREAAEHFDLRLVRRGAGRAMSPRRRSAPGHGPAASSEVRRHAGLRGSCPDSPGYTRRGSRC